MQDIILCRDGTAGAQMTEKYLAEKLLLISSTTQMNVFTIEILASKIYYPKIDIMR